MGGNSYSPNFPLVNQLQSTTYPGLGSGFLVKMSPDGTILFSSYFGGLLGISNVNGIAFDHDGNVYITGITDASDFLTTPGLPASPVNNGASNVSGAFVTKLDSGGQKIFYSALVGHAEGKGIAIDGAGNAFAAGNAFSDDLPVTIGGHSSSGAFALKINAAGNKLDYLTFIGPPATVIDSLSTSTSVGTRPIAVDSLGNAYITGYSNNPQFPTTSGAYQATFTGGGDPEAFAMKLNPAGSTTWATFLGVALNGSRGNAVSLDSSDNVWLTGGDGSLSARGGGFIDQLSADGATLLYSAHVPLGEAESDLTVDDGDVVHLAGSHLVSTITPEKASAPRAISIVNAAPGTALAFTGELNGLIAPGEIISIYGSGLGPATPVGASPHNGLFPTSLSGVEVLVDGAPIPLLYVSASQINAEIPSPLDGIQNGLALLQVII